MTISNVNPEKISPYPPPIVETVLQAIKEGGLKLGDYISYVSFMKQETWLGVESVNASLVGYFCGIVQHPGATSILLSKNNPFGTHSLGEQSQCVLSYHKHGKESVSSVTICHEEPEKDGAAAIED